MQHIKAYSEHHSKNKLNPITSGHISLGLKNVKIFAGNPEARYSADEGRLSANKEVSFLYAKGFSRNFEILDKEQL